MGRQHVSGSDVKAELDHFDAELEIRTGADNLPSPRAEGAKRSDTDAFTDGLARCQRGVASIAVDAELYWVAGRVWNCTHVLADDYCQMLDLPARSSYAQAARRIRAAGIHQSGSRR